MDFVSWLKGEIKERDWSAADLARKANISRTAVSNVFSGERSPGPDFCRSVARALDYPPELVFRKAGLLPPAPAKDEEIEKALYLLSQLPQFIRRLILIQIRALTLEYFAEEDPAISSSHTAPPSQSYEASVMDETSAMDFVSWLEGELAKRDWSRSDLARRAQIQVATLSHVLNRERNPGPVFCRAVARALNVPQYEVFYRAGLLTHLPPEIEKVPAEARQLVHHFLKLPPDEQEDLFYFVERRSRRQEAAAS